MTRPLEFIRAIVPAGGYYAIVGIKNKVVKQSLINDLGKAKGLVQGFMSRQEDAYFGCASFVNADSRTKSNVYYVKSFWIDLDCGEGTAYETQQDGLAALRGFCQKAKMPKPWVVNSGRGLHVYWPLTEPILAPLWSTYSSRLVDLCASAGLEIKDPGCSTDAARILRIPGTLNFKNPDDPLAVVLLMSGAVSEWSDLSKTIQTACGQVGINGFHEKPAAPATRAPVDALTAALAGNVSSSFSKIVKRSLAGSGCEHIAHALNNQAEVTEPLWRSVLSTAKFCEDGAKSIHKISRGHPEYTPEDTEKKAAQIKGPYNCQTYADQAGSARCVACANRGKITNPIQLGKMIMEAENPIAVARTAELSGLPVEGLTEAELLPELPWPYFRGREGGIYAKGPKGPDGEEGEAVLIYEYNLDVVRRLSDPEKGETLIIHLALPKDGVRELAIPLADAQSADRMKDKLGFYGVAAGKEQMIQIGIYLTRMVKRMQAEKPAEPARTQMGWTEDRQGIVWGRTMFTKAGMQYCPPAAKATTAANMMKTSGTLQAWEAVASRYAEPGSELYACCLIAAFGSMLNNYTYEDPVWVHLVSSQSGTGKTTLTRVMNSIWGDPTAMAMTVTDTVNAVEKRRVAFNSMAVSQDEITNLPPEKLSQLAYAQSQGREKLRLTSGSTEMVNHDRRNNTFFSTGNRYISDVLSSFKTNAAGEFARLVEVSFSEFKAVVSGDDHFGVILKNYGHAGPLFAQWLVENEDKLQSYVDRERVRFEKAFHSVSRERNWVALTSTMFAALRILQVELGLLTAYDSKRLYKVWVSHMESVRSSTAQHMVTHEQLLGDFINENYSNIIVPDANVSNVINSSPATASLYGRKTEREARNKLVIRWEKDTQRLYVAQHDLKMYCIKRTHSYVDLLAHFAQDKQFVGIESKRMGSNTGVITGPTKVLTFRVSNGELGAMLEGGGR